MNLWDLNYLSSSDDEDNDEDQSSDENDDSDAEYENKRHKRKPRMTDVVDKLIEKDEDLTKRDFDSRMRKLKMR
jgi:hypothetical protein